MPEGPSIVILKEELQPFIGQKVVAVGGNTSIPISWIKGQKIIDLKSWGKHFLICFKNKTIRIHFLLFGTYRINSRKDMPPRLQLQFKKGEINFYTSSIRIIEEDINSVYDWEADVMNKSWNPRKAKRKLKEEPDIEIADALLNQSIFAGVGNIIKNEVLFRIRIQPESRIGHLPPAKLSTLIKAARDYSFDFLKWKKAGVLKRNWKAHRKTICPRCDIPLIKKKTGVTRRQSYYCGNCQILY